MVAMIELTSDQRRQLRARAHALHPVASLGQQGLTEAVLKEIGHALDAHGLIKVKLHGIEREDRAALLDEICTRLECAPVQHIGHILVLWREPPDKAGAALVKPALRKRPAQVRTKKQMAARLARTPGWRG